jgi:succinate dehydrogenase/fumarate reductase cytochrome b subunit
MREGKLWTWHLICGVVIAVFLSLHMLIMHLDSSLGWFNPAGGHPIDWANVAARGQSLFFTLSYVALLGAALFHGLYGFRNILFELSPPAGLKKAINVLFVVGGLGLFGLGAWAAIASHQVSKAF